MNNEYVTVDRLIGLLNKPENKRTSSSAERVLAIQVNGKYKGYITSAKMEGWGSGLIADVCLEIQTDMEDEK